ncbi:hypothetical protein Ddye_015446 [Dipteronia dyeriana]|uniref:Transposase MuDR plant domain-containing protein n=1 Tax=Dipteronia dyeriana TaxID=168575 RepID=A0AAD9WZB3_9ROSI|nr:hypothetical protein Ddye_015446 [Dipteronia dyeriana]
MISGSQITIVVNDFWVCELNLVCAWLLCRGVSVRVFGSKACQSLLMDNIFNITVLHGTNVIDLGQCDADHISLIMLVHALSEQLTAVWVQLPWCSDIVEVFTDRDLLVVFREFGVRKSNPPIKEPEVVEQIGWCDDEASKFDYVAVSDGESIESGSDEENDDNGDGVGVGLGGDNGDGVGLGGDNGDDVGLGGDDGDGKWLGADNRDDEGLDGDNGDDEGLDVDDEDSECLGADNRDDEGLDGDNGDGEGLDCENGDCEGLSGDDGDGECLGADNGDGKGLDGDNGDSEGLSGDNRDGVFGSQFENIVGNDDITKELQEGAVLDRIKNDKQRQTYQCNATGCPWRAHASWMVDKTTFMIKILVDQHEFHRVCNNKEAKVKWIASKFESIVKSNPSINVKVLAELLLDKFNMSIDLKRHYSVKHRVLKQLRSKHVQSFQYLRQYAYTLNRTNPGTTIHIRVQRPLSTFHRLFLSFEAKIGSIKALAKHFPAASKRFCARHIYANFRGSYCGASFKKLFWRASRSTNIYDFNVALKDIDEIKVGAKEWLAKIEPHLWSRFAFDKVIRCDHVTNNMTEAFNGLLGTHRAQTYLQLVEFIRRIVMRKFQERKEECDVCRTVLPPKVHAKILKHSKTSRQMTIISAGNKNMRLWVLMGIF